MFKPGDLVTLVAVGQDEEELRGIVGVVTIEPPLKVHTNNPNLTSYPVFWLSKNLPLYEKCRGGHNYYHENALELFDWQKEGARCETT